MNNSQLRACDVKIGDNVWEHNIVREISVPTRHGSRAKVIVFNASGAFGAPWFAELDSPVMVTNRPNK